MTRDANTVSRWLVDGDCAIRWQMLRDVIGTAERTVERDRQKVAREVSADVIGRLLRAREI